MTQCVHIVFMEEKEYQGSCRRVSLDLTGWGDKIINNFECRHRVALGDTTVAKVIAACFNLVYKPNRHQESYCRF